VASRPGAGTTFTICLPKKGRQTFAKAVDKET